MFSVTFVCAAGNTEEELAKTIQSFNNILNKSAFDVKLSLLIVVNNGLMPNSQINREQVSFIDINPKADRSLARNTGIEYALKHDPDYLIFIDSGDYVHADILKVFEQTNETSGDLVVGHSLVNANDIQFIKKPRPLYLKNIVNPFYLSSVLVHRKIYRSVRFGPFPKEDWRFWIDCLSIANNITYNDHIYYQYNIRSVNDHIYRKSRLVYGQFKFLRERHGVLSTLLLLILHYVYLIIYWGAKKIWG